uniref:Uncharacterized protein n=1 Tax=Zea mays TaxID=4577 RepID=A0A804UA68_MAIZE
MLCPHCPCSFPCCKLSGNLQLGLHHRLFACSAAPDRRVTVKLHALPCVAFRCCCSRVVIAQVLSALNLPPFCSPAVDSLLVSLCCHSSLSSSSPSTLPLLALNKLSRLACFLRVTSRVPLASSGS